MEIDYSKVGLKCGLEVHQQLNTSKLFCRCPSILREDKPTATFSRRLRPVPSELGEYDPAALEAYLKGQTYVYEAYSDSTCLVEADEEPAMVIDQKALETALEIAMLINAKPIDEIVVMRKMVLDGSNTSGYQRTALVATDGFLEINGKKIGIPTLIVEEDAARPLAKTAGFIFYRLDRLGIPLVELSTAPDISSPEEAKQTALKIGEIFRLTGKVRRGLGSIRQDVNISIVGGSRIEIKGVQELEKIDEYVRREVQRQLGLLEIRDELKRRGAVESMFPCKNGKCEAGTIKDVSEIFANTQCKIISDGLKTGKIVSAAKLPKFAGIIGRELQPDRRFGTEIADYLKVKAGVKGLFHSDELPKYGISQEEVEKIKAELGCSAADAFALVCELPEKSEKAIGVVLERCAAALKGVPEETRNALPDGNSEYSRPLPGAARMYPETDLPTVTIDKKMLEQVRKNLPLNVEERRKLYSEKFKLSKNLLEGMLLSNWARFFEDLCKKGFEPTAIAVLLLEGLTQLKRDGVNIDSISKKMIEAALAAQKAGKITRDSMLPLLGSWAKKSAASFEEIVKEIDVGVAADAEAKKIIAEIVNRNQGLVREKGMVAFSALMGEAMEKLRGKVAGETVAKLLREAIQKASK